MNTYSCPMHPEIKSSKPGKCSVCGMDLTKVTSNHDQQSKIAAYRPLIIIISLIITPIIAVAIQELLLGSFMWRDWNGSNG